VQRVISVPTNWVSATARDGQAEVSLYLPQLTYTLGERASALVVLRNVGADPFDPRACNGNIYFELLLRDAAGQEVFSWTREHFPPRPDQAVLPRCTFMGYPDLLLPSGQAVQGTLDFRVPTVGSLSVVARRFQASTPAAALIVTAQPA
jgi:hypothetical protein